MQGRFFLREHMPGALEQLEINVRDWPRRAGSVTEEIMELMKIHELVGLRIKFIVRKAEEREWKGEIAKLDEDERGRIELVAV